MFERKRFGGEAEWNLIMFERKNFEEKNLIFFSSFFFQQVFSGQKT